MVPFFKRREAKPLGIAVPRLNDQVRDVAVIASMFTHAKARSARGITIPIDFSECDFLRPTAVAAIGGIVAQIKHSEGDAAILTDTIRSSVRSTLRRNGFLAAHGLEKPHVTKGQTQVTYRHDKHAEATEFARFLSEEWLERHWFTVGAVQPEIIKDRGRALQQRVRA